MYIITIISLLLLYKKIENLIACRFHNKRQYIKNFQEKMFGQSNVLWTPYGQTQGGAGRVAYAANGNVYVQTLGGGTQRVGFVVPPQQQQQVVVVQQPQVWYGTNSKGKAVKYVKYPGQAKPQKYYVTDRKTVTDKWGRPQSIWYWSDGTTTKKSL